MSLNIEVSENVKLLFEKLESFVQSKTIFGEPLQIGEVTLIPVTSVSFGLGAGGGDGVDEKGSKGVGGGSGVGAKVSPTAMIIIKGDKVEIQPIKTPGSFEKILEMVPEIMAKVNFCKEDKE